MSGWWAYAALFAAVLAGEVLVRSSVRRGAGGRWPREYLGGRVRITPCRNSGLAGSRWQQHPQRCRAAATLATLLLTLCCCWLWPDSSAVARVGLSLLLAGSAANTGERWLHGSVTDYLRFPRWPRRLGRMVWNLADCCLLVGLLLVVAAQLVSG